MNRIECSNCESHNTRRVHAEWHIDQIEEIRLCKDCPAQFINRYDLYEVEQQNP